MSNPQSTTEHLDKINELTMALLSLANAYELPDSIKSVIQEVNHEVSLLCSTHLAADCASFDALARANGYSDYATMVEETGTGFDFEE